MGLELLGDDVFVSVAGGLEVDEPAADLGVAAAVASSFRNRPLPAHTAVFGEVGLARRGAGRRAGGAALARGRADGLHALHPSRPQHPSRRPLRASRPVGVNTLDEALEHLLAGD